MSHIRFLNFSLRPTLKIRATHFWGQYKHRLQCQFTRRKEEVSKNMVATWGKTCKYIRDSYQMPTLEKHKQISILEKITYTFIYCLCCQWLSKLIYVLQKTNSDSSIIWSKKLHNSRQNLKRDSISTYVRRPQTKRWFIHWNNKATINILIHCSN